MQELTKALSYLFFGIGLGISGIGIILIYASKGAFFPLSIIVIFGFIFMLDGAVISLGSFVKEHKALHKRMEEVARLQKVQNTVMHDYDRYGLKKEAG